MVKVRSINESLETMLNRAKSSHESNHMYFIFSMSLDGPNSGYDERGVVNSDFILATDMKVETVLNKVSNVGWTLHDCGYVFRQTEQGSESKVKWTGSNPNVEGYTRGIFTFKRKTSA